MKSKTKDIVMQDKAFLYVAAATAVLLSVPALLMLFQIQLLDPGSGYEVLNWDLMDFVVMGTLIFGAGSVFVLAARKWRKNRLAIGVAVLLAVLWIWAELAVGVFTNWGS